MAMFADDHPAPRAPRLLVAEDNPANQRLLDIILSSLGYGLTMVDDGRKAVQAAEADGFDLVLMDLRMPVVDGFEAARRIRRLPHPQGATPIVAVTADTGPQVEPNVLAAGMNACLFKPIDIARLTESVAAWAGAGPLLPRDARSARRADRGPSGLGA